MSTVYNKVTANNQTLIDLSQDTVTSAAHIVSGYVGHLADGTQVTGTGGGGGSTPTYQAKTDIVPTESSQTITADSGYDALSSVQINAISSNYIGSSVPQKSSTDLSVSGRTVTVPAGYYASQATASVATGTATTPATTVTANPTISVNSSTGVITATASSTKSVTPTVSAGYISSGTAGTITVSGSNTSQLTTQAAQTIHPSTSDQTITSGKYLTGTQTYKAVVVSGLSANVVLSGTTVKIGDNTDDDCVTSVTGSVAFQTIYSGSSNPSSSQGVNGDIYIKTA